MTQQEPIRIVLLCGDGDSSRAVFHALADKFDISVVRESPASRIKMYQRRCTTLGTTTVIGQIAFLLLIVPILKRFSMKRRHELVEKYNLCLRDIPADMVTEVGSVNSPEAREVLTALRPDLVVVNGTRIIGKKTLEACGCTMINTHHGITPAYRGVHGGYWALADRQFDQVGSTIHRVDSGIDTGGVVAYARFEPTDADCFVTYPLHHVGAAKSVLLAVVGHFIETRQLPSQVPVDLKSKLRTHPTLLQYIYNRIRYGVK